MVCVGHLVHCLACLKPIRMHLVLEHITKGPEDPVGTEVFRESTGREKQKETGSDSPASRGERVKNRKKMTITNEMKFSSFQ